MKRIVSALCVLIGLFAAGAFPAGAEGINYEAFPEKLLLRMETRSPYLSELEKLTRIPEFSLYGDGTVIIARIDSGAEKLTIMKARLSPGEMEELLAFIRDQGILEWEDILDKCPLPDMPVTTFTLQSLSSTRRVKVYAMAYSASTGQIPGGMARVYERLSGFSHGSADVYQPVKARLFVRRMTGNVDSSRARVETWKPGLNLSKVKDQSPSPDFRETVVEGRQLGGLLRFLEGKTLYSRKVVNLFFSQKREVYQVGCRPLLPEE